MHIHIDPVGGIAGDMFVAALLDAYPEYAEATIAAVRAAGLDDDITLAHAPWDDGVLTGSRFVVTGPAADTQTASAHAHPQDEREHQHHHHDHGSHHDQDVNHHHPADHGHVQWSQLQRDLAASALAAKVRERAIAIFEELAHAEAKVHGKSVADVTFHEVGNWDSIADIVAAAYLIERIGAVSWSLGSLPLGSGRVMTAHGELPVPAPATTLLLQGFDCHDDGRAGERVTPTGAAIVRHLTPRSSVGIGARKLTGVGYGFGTRRLPGMSNVVRMMMFDSTTRSAPAVERIGVIEFELDDQTAEDLAEAVEQLRDMPGVIDVLQVPVFGKKGRMMTSLRLLTVEHAIENVVRSCFEQTTTLGLRTRVESRQLLARREVSTGADMRVKIADRLGADSAKADIEAVRGRGLSHEARQRLRRDAETSALDAPSRGGVKSEDE